MICSPRMTPKNDFLGWWIARLPPIRCKTFRIWRMRVLSTAQSLRTALTFAILVWFWLLLILSIWNVVFYLIPNSYVIKISGTRGAMLLLSLQLTQYECTTLYRAFESLFILKPLTVLISMWFFEKIDCFW